MGAVRSTGGRDDRLEIPFGMTTVPTSESTRPTRRDENRQAWA
jgi:hypothetical protein